MPTLNKLIASYSPILLSENEDRKNVIKAVEKWLQQYKPTWLIVTNHQQYLLLKKLLKELKQQ